MCNVYRAVRLNLNEANECNEAVINLFEAFFPEPSTSCLRPSVPSSRTVWALSGSTGIVAALSGSFGVTTDTEGSSSREPLSLISDSMGTVESPAAP